MLTVGLLFTIGLVCIIKGGDWFVDSATEIARISGLTPIFIGATIVSVATTLPELIVSVMAALHGETTMSIGNGVGSMICNIGLILSISAVFGNIKIKDKHFKAKFITLIVYTVILIAMSLDGKITQIEAFVLIGMLILYLYSNIKLLTVKNQKKIETKEKEKMYDKAMIKHIAMNFILGITFIIIGSNVIVDNGIILAEYIGIPTAIISLTIIALGTSLPELVTGISSLAKGNEEIGLGNIIGANILNIVLVIGGSGVIRELTVIPQNIMLDMPIALILSLILAVPAVIYKKVYKIQGILMVAIYVSYIIYVWQRVI